jgi:hypothetical protein
MPTMAMAMSTGDQAGLKKPMPTLRKAMITLRIQRLVR